ncbi:hypothetical protein SU69_00910 [Thermosipho melanesiensis]|uniref:Uncharacterized protein n=1 Tax=Thermosipho melanesiensis TaxID=46541 RepID=A0ABM6GGK6_9BACT|nr:hypothetical protein BW47_00940 [Thermosipho melanesiensis]OOC38641.1 hypothetical protein SU68_00910 [Thermosipho melanesiensis]OOC40445.1 hypothetical protein SU70_00910 [Thermosipho melanesiensis]OOC40710.1 hypothetical protein SU69_00910 [Thermosipho melanesiensis]OOC44556.1 hypothetical protein SU71_00900 [Thermosipho melanesiensis]
MIEYSIKSFNVIVLIFSLAKKVIFIIIVKRKNIKVQMNFFSFFPPKFKNLGMKVRELELLICFKFMI